MPSLLSLEGEKPTIPPAIAWEGKKVLHPHPDKSKERGLRAFHNPMCHT